MFRCLTADDLSHGLQGGPVSSCPSILACEAPLLGPWRTLHAVQPVLTNDQKRTKEIPRPAEYSA